MNTADCNRSHLKNYLLHTYKVLSKSSKYVLGQALDLYDVHIKVDLDDKIRFPQWGSWWKAYQGEVLKPQGKMQVCANK